MAIISALGFINDNPPNQTQIYIFTDCQQILQYLKFVAFPKYNNVKLLTEGVLKLLLLIHHKYPNLIIYLNKVKSHTNIDGNNIIDSLVRNATKQITYDKSQFNQIPYSVTLTQIHQSLTKSWKNSWKKKSNPNKWISKCHSKFNNNINNFEHLFSIDTTWYINSFDI